MTASREPHDPACLVRLGVMGGAVIYAAPDGAGGAIFFTHRPRSGWGRLGSASALVRAADEAIKSLKRRQLALIAVLAAFPLMLMALLVMVLAQPVAPPAPSLSMVAAVVGCLLTGGLIFLGAWAASAIMGPVRPAPDAPPP